MTINTTTTSTPSKSLNKDKEALRVVVNRSDIFKGIQLVQSAISTRSTLPILGNILFEGTDQGLRLSATDLEVGIRTWVKADVVSKGAITIPAKIISDFLRTLEDDREIKFDVQEGNKVELKSGRDRLNVTGLPKSDYPVLPEFDQEKAIEMPRETLRELIKKTVFSASTDETRYVLNGIHVIAENGKLIAVATDGRRLSYIQRPLADKKLKIKIILPTKAVQEVLHLVSDEKGAKETIHVSFTENQASFTDGKTVVLSRLIEGHFPNFEQVLPKSFDFQLKLDRTAFNACVARAAIGTMERGGSIRLSLTKGTMKIQAASSGRVEVESEMPVSYEGANFEIAFNPLYVMDVLKALDQQDVLVEFTSPLNPGVVRPADDESFRYVMMPMKV
jgi:DNA polymerase-3 subunit beta